MSGPEVRIEWGVRLTSGDVGAVVACMNEGHASRLVAKGLGDPVNRSVTRSAWRPLAVAGEYAVTAKTGTVHRATCGNIMRSGSHRAGVLEWNPGDPVPAESIYRRLTACHCLGGRLPLADK